jgi:hypothetical protein
MGEPTNHSRAAAQAPVDRATRAIYRSTQVLVLVFVALGCANILVWAPIIRVILQAAGGR